MRERVVRLADGSPARNDAVGIEGAKSRVTQAMDRLRRWTGVTSGSAAPRVRLAFSGERSEKAGKSARESAPPRAAGPDGGDEDR